jgi:hypothetical protein
MERVADGQAAAQFQVLSPYTNINPSAFRCPTDKSRIPATKHAGLSNTNLSYFINLDSVTNSPAGILAGDRHLQADGKPVAPGLFSWTTNQVIGWTRELHGSSKSPTAGILGFADGHTEAVRDHQLNSVFQRDGLSAKRLVVP